MNILIDTPTFLWSVLEVEKLTQEARTILTDEQNDLWLSPISLWEVANYQELGKISLNLPIEKWINQVFDTIPIREAPVTNHVMTTTWELKALQLDFADAIITSTALVYGHSLMTSNSRILEIPEINTIPSI